MILSEAIVKKIIGEAMGQMTSADRTRVEEIAHLILAEAARSQRVQARRTHCIENGGHTLRMSRGAGWSEMEMSSSGTTIMGWTGSGACEVCDAVLAITYRETL